MVSLINSDLQPPPSLVILTNVIITIPDTSELVLVFSYYTSEKKPFYSFPLRVYREVGSAHSGAPLNKIHQLSAKDVEFNFDRPSI